LKARVSECDVRSQLVMSEQLSQDLAITGQQRQKTPV